MRRMSSKEIRETWLNFFNSKGHHIEESASLIPNDDPSLLWINAGVSALKKYFDGREIPPSKRLVNLQKCIRTNDIENVGRTARHHTFFEMMGNFSIGDYFKNEAIEFAIELLTSEKYFNFPIDKLYITYYPEDLDTYKKWISVGIKEDHLIASSDNFWEIGEGPCGPDTEIYFDRGEKYDPNHLGPKMIAEDIDNDRYIEIWNIVLSQFNAKEGLKRSEYKELPNKNIDTGAGLERFACILQESESNFETDLFLPLIKEINKYTTITYEDNTMSYRVIADHIKACVFALSDGAYFSNEGRGYVLRRLLRRSVLHAHRLNINEPFIYKLVDVVIDIYSSFYPKLTSRRNNIIELIKAEEEKFFKTLIIGENLLKEMIKARNIDAFKLYDTYGFPLELTIEIANEYNQRVDINIFKQLMEEQKQRARDARINVNSMQSQAKDLLDCNLPSSFIYDNKYIKSKVIAIFKNGEKVDFIEDSGEVMFDKTTFYATMGGQIADIGTATNKTSNLSIENVILSPHKQHLHIVKVNKGSVKVGDSFTLKLNKNRRRLIMRNHTATHLLDATLTNLLSKDIEQKGSYVGDDYLRFDFNYNNKIDENTLTLIEHKINEVIASSLDVTTLNLKLEDAKKLGAKMVFTEKYGENVRVVKVGNYSMEFCGGTHVNNTSDIGIFKIISEESIASGIRRITAKTSLGAYEYIKNKENIINEAMKKLNARSDNEINVAILTLLKEKDNLKNNLKNNLNLLASNYANNIKKEFMVVDNINFLCAKLENANRELLINVANIIKSYTHNYLLVLFGVSKEGIAMYISSDVSGINANYIAKEICKIAGGSGGGKPSEANGRIASINDFNKIKEMIIRL